MGWGFILRVRRAIRRWLTGSDDYGNRLIDGYGLGRRD